MNRDSQPRGEFLHITPDIVVRPFKVVLAGHKAEALEDAVLDVNENPKETSVTPSSNLQSLISSL